MSAPSAERLHPVAFWFLRHGETDWNAQNLSQGAVDIPLNETGLAQARSASLLLRGRGIRAIISSPLSRARVTADIAAAQLGLSVQIDDGLKEVAFGVMEGKPMSEWFQPWVDGMRCRCGVNRPWVGPPFGGLPTRTESREWR
jgi:broad specificity phosphatase PhoE